MKRFFTIALAAVASIACQKEIGEYESVAGTFTACVESCDETRTFTDESLQVKWSEGDYLNIWEHKRAADKYTIVPSSVGKNYADLDMVSAGSNSGFVASLSANIGFYPYDATIACSADGAGFRFENVVLPATQTYAAGSFGNGAMPMVAVSSGTDDYNLGFKNVCGVLRIVLSGDQIVKSISITGNNGEILCGPAEVIASHGNLPTIEMTGNGKTVTLDCGEGVQLGKSTSFDIVLPPVTFSKGFTVMINSEVSFTTEKQQTVTRSRILSMANKTAISNNYLTFTSEGAKAIYLNKEGTPDEISLLYFKDSEGEWKTYTVGEAIALEEGENVRFKAGDSGNVTFSKDINNFYYFSTRRNGKVRATGNVMSLLDANCESVTCPQFCFAYLFYDCSGLTAAPELPASVLGNNCYRCMFHGCSKLTSAPDLPAMVMADNCYCLMFEDCTSLTSSPSTPATQLATDCYSGMFSGCTNLCKVSALPATVLSEGCYSFMFSGCTSLSESPDLPATNLKSKCYYGMFDGCTGLSSAPSLPSMKLADACYGQLFHGCTGLTSAPELPATTLAQECYGNMFSGCTGLTTAPELPATTLAPGCYWDMFSCCESLTSAPKLPAEALVKNCYQYMFTECYSLTSAPDLPAKTLAEGCYEFMFAYCTKLNHIKMLATDISAKDCLNQWTYQVSRSGSFVKSPDATWDVQGNSGIPSGWTVVNEPTGVDLGLSVKWAPCNLGANAPEGYGDYYAWGATSPLYKTGYAQEDPQAHWKTGKSDGYCWNNTPYQTANTTNYGQTKWTKYVGSTTSTYKDASATNADALKTVLDPEDDAARSVLGTGWRMPTKAEWGELMNTSNCSWTWTTLNGVNGYKVQSKKSGFTDKWIFLPASGYRWGDSLYDLGDDGNYWSSSLHTTNPFDSFGAYFSSSRTDSYYYPVRFYGFTIRPVTN